jgi:hypothetical protein
MEQNFMRIYYKGYVERLGDRFQLIQLEKGETWQTVSER